MIESIFHFFKIHRKMIFGNPAIIVLNMLRKTPKTLNPVDMIPAAGGKCLAVIQAVVLAQPFQRIVAPEGVSIIHRALAGLFPDDGHKLFFGHMLHHSRIYLAIALQQAKNNVFTGCASSARALASAAKVALVHFHFAVQLTALKFSDMIDRFPQALVDTRNGLVVQAEVTRKAVRRLLLVETSYDGNFSPYALQRLLFATGLIAAAYISPRGPAELERPAEHALFTPQKVGRASENVLSSCNHKDILAPRGYETH